MKRDKIFTSCWAGALALLLGLGSVGSLISGLELPVWSIPFVVICSLLALGSGLLTAVRRGVFWGLGLGLLPFLHPDFPQQIKTLGASIAQRLWLAYQIPVPEVFQGEMADTLLPIACLLSYGIILITAHCVHKQKRCFLPVALSLLPLTGCITVTDTVPDSLWLFLWGLGLVLLLLTQGVRRQSHLRGNRLSAGLFLPAVAAMVLLFALIPRDGVADWWLPIADPAPPSSSQTGISPVPVEQVDLRALGPRNPTRTKVMEVTADYGGSLYLRCRDYDQYTGTGWVASQERNEILYGHVTQGYYAYGQVAISTQGVREHYVIPNYTRQAQSLTGGVVENPNGETDYRFERWMLNDDWMTTWTGNDYATTDPRYLKLPEETKLHAEDYLRDYLSGQENALLKVQKIRDAVKNSGSYDLFTPNMPMEETDLAMWFLGSSDTGYCVHFATAATVLLRAAGIPARYVEGYLVQTKAGETAVVQERHAHAWVEYYLDKMGWVILEATPSDGIVQEEEPEVSTTEATPEPTEKITEPTQEAVTEPTQPQGQKPQTPSGKKRTGEVLLWTSGICLLLALLEGQYALRRQLLKKALKTKDRNRRGLLMYRQVNRLCRFLKKPVPQELTDLAQKARFSPHRLTKQELTQLNTALKQCQSEVKKTSIIQRLYARDILALY